MLPKDDVQLEIDPDPELEREAEETAQRVMKGGKLDIQRMSDTEVHVQRSPYGVERASRFNPGARPGRETDSDPLGDTIQGKIDEATTKTYRLTKAQLTDIVQSVETKNGLAEYIEHHNIEAASQIQDSASGTIGGAMKGWKAGSALGSLAGPVGTLAGGLAGVPVGAILASKFGKEAAGKVQGFIRDTLGLNINQEFGTAGDTEATRFD